LIIQLIVDTFFYFLILIYLFRRNQVLTGYKGFILSKLGLTNWLKLKMK